MPSCCDCLFNDEDAICVWQSLQLLSQAFCDIWQLI